MNFMKQLRVFVKFVKFVANHQPTMLYSYWPRTGSFSAKRLRRKRCGSNNGALFFMSKSAVITETAGPSLKPCPLKPEQI